jgi:hypothetical protein
VPCSGVDISESRRLGDAPSGPDIASKPKGLGSTRQQLGQLRQLFRRQSRRRTRRWSMAQGGHNSRSATTRPSADGAFGHSQRCRNRALLPAILLEIPGAQPPQFAPILAYPTRAAGLVGPAVVVLIAGPDDMHPASNEASTPPVKPITVRVEQFSE